MAGGHQRGLERVWPGGVAGGPWVGEVVLLGVTAVVPLGVVGRAVPDGFGTPGWVLVALAVVSRAGPPLCAGAVWSAGRVVPSEGCATTGCEARELLEEELLGAAELPGMPGMGSSAAGGIGPPANPMPSMHAYPHSAATTAIVRRRQFLRRRPEASTNTGDDCPGSAGDCTGSVDVCTASGGPHCAVPQRRCAGRPRMHSDEKAHGSLHALHRPAGPHGVRPARLCRRITG